MDTRTLREALGNIREINTAESVLIEDLFQNYANNKLQQLINPLLDEWPLTWDMQAAKNLKQFLYELAEYYELYPSLGYNFLPHSYLNQACLAVATFLQPILGINRYQLLMPQLKVLKSDITTTNLVEEDLPLHQFIQSEDRFIEVGPCLEFAAEDAILKHTTLVNNKVKPLNVQQEQLVMGHSDSTQQYADAIRAKYAYQTQGNSYGAALKRLADGLKEGGVFATGVYDVNREVNAASNANEAIYFFSVWLETLSQEEQHRLMAFSADGKSVKDVWMSICEPRGLTVSTCVDINGGYLYQILKNNPQLYDLYPANFSESGYYDAFENGLELLEKKLSEKREKFSTEFENSMYWPIYSLPKNKDKYNEFVIKFLSQDDLPLYLIQLEGITIRDQSELEDIVRLLRRENMHENFCNLLQSHGINIRGKPFAQSHVNFLNTNRHKRFVNSSARVAHALIVSDNGDEKAKQYSIPSDNNGPRVMRLASISSDERGGYHAITEDNTQMQANRYLHGDFDGQPFKIACFSPVPVHNLNRIDNHTPPFFKEEANEVVAQIESKEKNRGAVSVIAQDIVDKYNSFETRLNSRDIMGQSAQEAYAQFFREWKNEITPEMRRIIKNAIDADEQDQHRPEWLHAKPYFLFPSSNDVDQADNMGAAAKWANVEMMLHSHIVRWFAINRPLALERVHPQFEMLLDSELIKKIIYDIYIEEKNHVMHFSQDTDPFQPAPAFRKATDLMQAVAITDALLGDVAPVSTISIFAQPPQQPLSRKRSIEEVAEPEEQGETKRARMEPN